MSLFDELLNDERQISLALGALTSNVSSDWEKLGNALVLLLTDALKERLADLPPPDAPATRSTGLMTDENGNLLSPTTKNPQTAVKTNADGFLVDLNGNLVDANGNRVAQGVKAS